MIKLKTIFGGFVFVPACQIANLNAYLAGKRENPFIKTHAGTLYHADNLKTETGA